MDSPVLPPKDRSFQHLQEKEVDVLVVGAGLPGLRAAVDVHQAGFSVLVLEASETIGGKTSSVPASDSNPREWSIFDKSTILGEAGRRGIYKLAENHGAESAEMAGGRRASESSEGSVTPNPQLEPHGEGEGTRYFSLEELIEEAEQAETGQDEPRVWTSTQASASVSSVGADRFTTSGSSSSSSSTGASASTRMPQSQGDTYNQRAATALALDLLSGAIRLCSPTRLVMHTSSELPVIVHAGLGTGTRYRANRVVVSMPGSKHSKRPSLPQT